MRPCKLASSKYKSKTSPGKDKRSRSKAAVLLGTYLVREGLTYALKVLTHAGVVDLTDNCCKDQEGHFYCVDAEKGGFGKSVGDTVYIQGHSQDHQICDEEILPIDEWKRASAWYK